MTTKRIAGPRLPIVVTEIAYSEAAIWANRLGMSLRDYTEAALTAANQAAERQIDGDLFEFENRARESRREPTMMRHEFDQAKKPRRAAAPKPVASTKMKTPLPGDDVPPDDRFGPPVGDPIPPRKNHKPSMQN